MYTITGILLNIHTVHLYLATLLDPSYCTIAALLCSSQQLAQQSPTLFQRSSGAAPVYVQIQNKVQVKNKKKIINKAHKKHTAGKKLEYV